ncbi:ankyrin repeat protein [Deerpox virus W-1170-84]|uniref:Ankyrin repeat protein n=1 Tax=Deerpox virus (strain W-1170-84) TaxID=305676 RepID=Q08FG1_DPV84|nr:ankyrin repeat protein [Deerpox virus W-1170-84]
MSSIFYIYRTRESINYPLYYSRSLHFFNNMDKVKAILDNGYDINQITSNSLSLLHYSTLTDNVNIVKLLLERGANINVVDKYGCTPLYYYMITKRTSIDMIKTLLDNGADVNMKTSSNENLLHAFTESNLTNVDILNLFIDKINNIDECNNCGKTPLTIAVEKGNISVAKILLDRGANPFTLTTNNDTLLHCYHDSKNILEKVKLLLELGLSPNTRNDDGDTPFHKICCLNPNEELIKLLIENGADINIQNNEGNTPFHNYMYEYPEKFNLSVLKLFFDNGVDINIKNKYHKQPFNIISCSLDITEEIVNMFIENGVDINNKNIYGYSAIHNFAINPNINIVKTWLDCGANPNDKTITGYTPVHISARNKNSEIFKLIIERGGDIHSTDKYGNTPFHEAINNINNLKILSSLGISDSTNNNGESALHKAIRYNKINSVKFLLKQKSTCIDKITNDGSTCITECFDLLNDSMLTILINARPSYMTMIKSFRKVKKYYSTRMLKKSISYTLLLDQQFYKRENSNYTFLMDHINDCHKEINVLKNIYIGYEKISAYNIIKYNNIDIALKHIKNKSFTKLTALSNYGIYFKILIHLAKVRYDIIKKSIDYFDHLCKDTTWSALPMEIKYMIINYLSNETLKSILNYQ